MHDVHTVMKRLPERLLSSPGGRGSARGDHAVAAGVSHAGDRPGVTWRPHGAWSATSPHGAGSAVLTTLEVPLSSPSSSLSACTRGRPGAQVGAGPPPPRTRIPHVGSTDGCGLSTMVAAMYPGQPSSSSSVPPPAPPQGPEARPRGSAAGPEATTLSGPRTPNLSMLSPVGVPMSPDPDLLTPVSAFF